MRLKMYNLFTESLKYYLLFLGILLVSLTNIDNLSGSQLSVASATKSCKVTITPDLPLISSNANIEEDINEILNKYEDSYLGTSAPSSSSLSNAIAQYNKLNISIVNGDISGGIVSSFTSVPFLKTFAQHLRFNPNDASIREKANNTVWLVSQQVCDGTLQVDRNGYSFRSFVAPAALLARLLGEKIGGLFQNTLDMHSVFRHLWEPVYDETYQSVNGTINTDIMYNVGDALMAYAANQPDADERYRWMRGFKRWVERFTNHTSGTSDGVKVDGTGFHHWTAYDGYMYAFMTACDVIYYLAGTDFQIGEEDYLRFRDAIYAQIVLGNESGVKALSMVGRNPQSRYINYGSSPIKRLALAGGQILGLSTADPVLAGEHNRIWGISPDFNYSTKTPLSQSSGFYQFNHANAGVYRKNTWLAVMKGFTDGLWGAELYETSNRYGRYQSYGTLEVIYSGSPSTGNGYDVNTWNWNYNPGATTIVLPWDKLHGEFGRIDEYQQNGFAGALAFNNKNSEALTRTHGATGVFAIDFQEKEGQGFGVKYGPNTHNGTFRFKKSTYAFDDMIICLGSDINNNDGTNPTVTTLFQRLYNNGLNLWVNGRRHRGDATFDGSSANWVISNYNTGFYLVEGNNDIKVWNGDQQTPNQNQTDPTAYTSNPFGRYWIGYIDHGTSPVDAGYEYMVIPEATTEFMTSLDNEMQAGNKPYTVHQKNSSAHILEHNSGVWAYTVFDENTTINNDGLLTHVSEPCLIMYEEEIVEDNNNTLKLAISNPDLGFTPRSHKASVEKTITLSLKGRWTILHGDVSSTSNQNELFTELSITLKDGLPVELDLKQDISSTIWNEKIGQNSFNLYPNPATKQVHLDGNFPENSRWTITNSYGVKLAEGSIKKNATIDISNFPNGIYFVNVIFNNKMLYVSKLMVSGNLYY